MPRYVFPGAVGLLGPLGQYAARFYEKKRW